MILNKYLYYVDSVLFAMFARTQSFDGLLYVQAEGINARGLQTHLRLFVNRLRSGKFMNSSMIKVSQSVEIL